MHVENMTLKIIIEEYYNLICEMNYLQILLNWVLEDNESIQFVIEKILINNNFKYMDKEKILKRLSNLIDDNNLKVISNPLVDWTILNNGAIALEHFISESSSSENEILKKYYNDIIMNAIKGNMCVFNNKYFKSSRYSCFERVTGLYLLSLYEEENIQYLCERLREDKFIKEIKEYLIRNDGYNHQLELYKEYNLQGDNGLNQIKLLRKNK